MAKPWAREDSGFVDVKAAAGAAEDDDDGMRAGAGRDVETADGGFGVGGLGSRIRNF